MNRWLPFLAAFVATATGAAAQPQAPHRHGPAAQQLRQIRTQTVRAAAIEADAVVAPGRIVVDPRRLSRVSLPMPGRVVAILVRAGDTVRAGDPLFKLESPEAETALAECRRAEATLSQSRAGVRRAQGDLDRLRDLLEHRAVARKEVQHAEEDLVRAEAEQAQAEAACAETKRRLEILGIQPGGPGQQVLVRAPIAGKVLELGVTQGEYRADTGGAAVTIADLTTVLVSSQVSERDIRLVEVGEAVSVELVAYPGQAFQGRVARISDVVDPRTRTIEVQAEIRNQGGRLRPEMYGRIRHAHAARQLPVVPQQAVVQSARGPFVFVERSRGRFERAPVKPGRTQDGQIAILEGLRPGDLVVVDGSMLLQGQQTGGGQ